MKKLIHKPMIPARPGHNGEQVYASTWAAAMEPTGDEDEGQTPIEIVLRDLDVQELTQRHATVAATVICWLGCNIGYATLRRAEAERAAGRWSDAHCYLFAWTLENMRRIGRNSNIRCVEYMLTPPDDRRETRSIGDVGITRLPELSAIDLEVIDHVMLWLAEADGQRFLRLCDAQIKALDDEDRIRRNAEFLRAHA